MFASISVLLVYLCYCITSFWCHTHILNKYLFYGVSYSRVGIRMLSVTFEIGGFALVSIQLLYKLYHGLGLGLFYGVS